MSDAIRPPMAARPDEACELVSAAVSDGDLDAALAHYEPMAVVSPGDGRILRGRDEIRPMLAAAAASRMLYAVVADQVLDTDGLALVSGHWSSAGTDAIGEPVRHSGQYWSVVRPGADGTWQIATEVIVPSDL